MNSEVISILERAAQTAELLGEIHRAKAYSGAILGIRTLNWRIRDNIDRIRTEKIPGVGKGIRARLIEFAETGTIRELVDFADSKVARAYLQLSKIAGAGPKTVAEWIRAGIFSLADLRKQLAVGSIELTAVQKYGLTYYSDLNSRIPRDEVSAISDTVCVRVHALDPRAKCVTAGSYRRGAPDSGDIDIITTGNYSLRELIAGYEADPNFIATFMLGSERTTFIYMGPRGKVRQIDVLLLSQEQFWPGILYFTGSWEFNAAMRGYAKARGYLLNQRGLFKIRGRAETAIKVQSEQEIFDILGLKYVEPPDRLSADNIVPRT